MQPHYDWQKGKDAWEEGEASGLQLPSLPPRRRLSIVLAVVLIIGLIGVAVFWILDRRARTNKAAVEEDILRTNSLVYQATAEGDLELLRNYLSGRDPRWLVDLESTVSDGLFFDRPFWGLHFQPSLPDDSNIEVKLSPEWDSAEVSVPLEYEYETADGGAKVLLEQTLVYRRSRAKWLLAPPDVDFWGDRLLFDGRYISVTYPERDWRIVERLAADLDAMMGEICVSIEDVNCAADFGVDIRLYTDSPDFGPLTVSEVLPPCNHINRELPAPTLVGLPVDDSGYEALFEGYMSEFATMALAGLIYSPECPSSPVTAALLDYRLWEMGFSSWPITESDYANLYEEQVHLEQVEYFIRNELIEPDGTELIGDVRSIYALVEFLIGENRTVLREIERDIAENPSVFAGYWAALHKWAGNGFDSNRELELAWEQFLVEKGDYRREDDINLPEQNLRLVCRRPGEFVVTASLYEFALAEERWRPVFTLDHNNGYLLGLLGDVGVIVAEHRLDSVATNTQVLLWEESEPVVLFESATNLLPVSVSEIPGGGEQLLVYNRRDRLYGVFSVADCETADSCELSPLPGFPIWSPSGERFLLVIPVGTHGYEKQFFRPFTMGQFRTITEPLSGKSQFWLSDERFGFVTEDGRTVLTLMVDEDGLSGEAEVLLTLEEIDPLLALDEAVTIESVLSKPDEPHVLVITVKDSEGWASIYQVNILLRRVQLLKERAFSLNTEAVYSFEFSPGTHWLVVSGNDLTTSTAYLHLSDLGREEVHSYEYKMVFDRPMHWTMDWSAGDEWLALPDNGYIRLINPAADFQDMVFPEGMGCSGAVWVN